MAHKKRKGAPPVPPGNQPQRGPGAPTGDRPGDAASAQNDSGTGFQEQDPKRRLGDYGGAGEHPYVQPGGNNDANR